MTGPLAVLAGLAVGTALASAAQRIARHRTLWRRADGINAAARSSCAMCGSREPHHSDDYCRAYLDAAAELDALAPDPPLPTAEQADNLARIRAGATVAQVAAARLYQILDVNGLPAARPDPGTATGCHFPADVSQRQPVAPPAAAAQRQVVTLLQERRITPAGVLALARVLGKVAGGLAPVLGHVGKAAAHALLATRTGRREW